MVFSLFFRRFFWPCAIVVGLALVGCRGLAASVGAPETRWTMINVVPGNGQADCHLIEFPDGRKVLVDIADGIDAGDVAVAYLRAHGIARIDLVVITHFHKDHYRRLIDLIKSGVQIDRVAVNMPAREDKLADTEKPWGFDRPDAEAVLQFLVEKHIPYFTPKIGEHLLDVTLAGGGSAALEVVCFYDGFNTPIGATSVNDTSMILRLRHGRTRALLAGDLTSTLGQWLAESDFDLAADVLKVQHHGADWGSSTRFFERVNPKAVLVTAPKKLWDSERDKPIRDYFAGRKIPAYVSSIHGDVTVVMTTQGFTVQTEHEAQ